MFRAWSYVWGLSSVKYKAKRFIHNKNTFVFLAKHTSPLQFLAAFDAAYRAVEEQT